MSTKRVYCLYRVSSVGQIDRVNDKDDIPLQKQACREFAEDKGWTVEKEFYELGVSGFKVSSKDRDALVEIQKDASLGKFDILLVFMFDRLGRREQETPFVVEWFVENGIEVWSVNEGQQRFDNHVDKLLNYIRYWQASGESIKTSVRTSTRLSQIVQEGHFKGGVPPYGYKLVRQGRTGRKARELYDLVIDEQEAAVVKLIFEKYVNEGFGAYRIMKYLMERGIRNRKGTNFPNTTITGMLKNITYMGILRSGETKSEIFPQYQIIEPYMFERAQEILKMRAERLKHSDVPLNTKSRALLGGLVYCAHCGGKLTLTTSGTRKVLDNGVKVPQIRYCCHYKVRHPDQCDGQSGYGQVKMDGIIDNVMIAFLDKIKKAPQNELVTTRVANEMSVWSKTRKDAEARVEEKAAELKKYKDEVKRALVGTSSFSPDILNELIEETKSDLEKAEADVERATEQANSTETVAHEANARHQKMLSWADAWQDCSTEAKKMIINQLIHKVKVGRNYRLEIDLNVSYKEYASYWPHSPVEEPQDEEKAPA